ncbi:hypothetical protein J2Z79_003050 [Symbiobacterium terraclitae]|uniref:DUF4127 family protein n=1 Tax=Symbiobacterium terraclitae TaxID=557451 RepID=A0ABS4JVS5_9FIRM|nr:DUF4127 family protein [Symbiobacterium terraclitae]MBP2019608.1 hypothetical protein [Symbiobacterium terraclitae]
MRILLIPVDARPVTRDIAVEVAAVAGIEVMVPPKEILGFLKEPADLAAIGAWMAEHLPLADAVVVSLDLLGYGGLCPSRFGGVTAAQVKERLAPVFRLKAERPDLPVYAFSATMRIPAYNSDAEEPEYWATYGYDLWRLSYCDDKYQVTGDEAARAEAEAAAARVPAELVAEFRARRARNFAVNLHALDMAEQGLLDLIVFPQDDTSEFGWNIAEQRQLRAEINRRGLGMKALIYPGADEVGLALVARAVNRAAGVTPKFYPFYSSTKGPLIHARYEDRPLGETVKGQIFACGGLLVDSPAEADILLAVNTPGDEQGEAPEQAHRRLVDTAGRNLPEFVARIAHYIREGRPVAVADLAYANGADDALISLLGETVALPDLEAYAGWNTAGNSMGTVAAHAAMRHLGRRTGRLNQGAHLSFLLKRFADDYLYQFQVRTEVREAHGVDRLPPDELLAETARRLEPGLRAFHARHFARAGELKLKQIYLPWKRSFEVGLDLEVIPR